ncbi:MAG: S8 family serine peptidase [Bdellovibrionales bacterium]|nr:S8 family serine peptidase [Bdellovibrionales bacterium]
MKFSLKNRRLSLALLALCAVQYFATTDFESTDSSSVSKKGRSAELGKPVPTKNKPEKEVEVLLNDPAISSVWGLKMTDSAKAWRISQGSRDITVCVIDTGADIHHPDLINNLWVNKGEVGKDSQGRDKATNGIDDDGNGLRDDVHGWNFANNSNDVSDQHGHGTHIAGIIGAEGGNGIGISGVSPKVSLMILKYYDPKGTDMNNLVNTVKAIDYAVNKDCNIINYSGGGVAPSPDEKAAIERAMRKGILFVAAAGNERSNSDTHKYYPADYGLPNILSVTAIDKNKKVLPSSNYGEQTVDIAAPGNDIISTLPNGQYGYMTGTSQATAYASGVAALVMANNPNLRKADQIIKYLTKTGDDDINLVGKTRYRKRLNSYRALAIQDSDLSFNGVRTENASAFSKNEFASDKNEDEDDNSRETASNTRINSFGKQIQSHLGLKQLQIVPKAEAAPSEQTTAGTE